MDEKQEVWLYNNYRVLYGRGQPYRKDGQFGFECGNGWFSIMNAIGMSFQDTNPPVASQVKEKFGTLRFYTDGNDDFADGVIDMAERLSARTCEISGKYGFLTNTGGWIRVLHPSQMTKETKLAMKDKLEAHYGMGVSESIEVSVSNPMLFGKELNLPAGIARLVQDTLNSIQGVNWTPARVVSVKINDIKFENGKLFFDVVGADSYEQGALKMAVNLASIMNPETGDLPVEPK